MHHLHTIAASLALGLSIHTATAGETWEYNEERASLVTREGEMDSRSKDGWRIIDIGATERGHLMILGRSSIAPTGRDAERTFVYRRTTIAAMAADLTAMGKDSYTVDSIVADADGYQVVYSRPRIQARTPLSGSQWDFQLVNLGDGTSATELRRAGDDGWAGLELLRDGATVYALMFRDAGAGAARARYEFEYRRILPASAADLTRASENHDIIAMLPDNGQIGLLLRRNRDQLNTPSAYDYQLLDGGRSGNDAERALNKAGADGWKLLDIDEDSRTIRLLMRRPKGGN